MHLLRDELAELADEVPEHEVARHAKGHAPQPLRRVRRDDLAVPDRRLRGVCVCVGGGE